MSFIGLNNNHKQIVTPSPLPIHKTFHCCFYHHNNSFCTSGCISFVVPSDFSTLEQTQCAALTRKFDSPNWRKVQHYLDQSSSNSKSLHLSFQRLDFCVQSAATYIITRAMFNNNNHTNLSYLLLSNWNITLTLQEVAACFTIISEDNRICNEV